MWASPEMSSDPRQVRVAVVIVSFNVCELLRKTLSALRRDRASHKPDVEIDVYVVDNASLDGSATMVREHFPEVELLASSQNLGFTGGNNLILKRWLDPGEPAPDLILLLNPDAVPAPGAIARMSAVMQAAPSVGACGGHLHYGDGTFQHGAFRFPDLIQTLLDLAPLAELPLIRRTLPRLNPSRINGRYPQSMWQGSNPFPVDFVLGAAMMVRTSALRNVGLFDDEFFMYCEEIDLAMRLQNAGWSVVAIPDALFTHYEGQSSAPTPWLTFDRIWRSRSHLFHKHSDRYPPTFHMLLRPGVWLLTAIRRYLALKRFARGRQDGVATSRELSSYARLERLFPQGS